MPAQAGDAAARPSRVPLLVLSLVAVGLYGWAASRGTPAFFYSGAMRTMSENWRYFFYGVFDPSGWITVDKVPGWLWVHALLVRVFGMHTWVLLLPEMLAAAGTVPLLHGAVRRWAGPRAALWAVLAFLATPATFAVAQVNIPDTLMVLCMVTAAYALTRALESAGWGWLLFSALLLGLGFQMKMAQALLCLPALCLACLVCGTRPPLARLVRTIVYGVVTLAVSSLWLLAVTLTPASARPKFDGGGSDGASAWYMALVYNGVGRASGVNSGTSLFSGTPGPDRLFASPITQQISWLLPAALLLGLAGLALALAGRADRRRLAGWLLWLGWLAAGWATLSLFSSSMHPYYTAVLAPPMAAILGAGLDHSARAWQERRTSGWLLPASVVLTAVWTLVVLLRQPSGLGWVATLVVVATVVTLALLLALRGGAGRLGALTALAGVTALIALLAAPVVWMLSTPRIEPTSMQVIDPTAGPAQFQDARERTSGNAQMPTVDQAMLAYVRAGDHNTRYALALGDTSATGPYLIDGVNALPLRGFNDTSPALPVSEISELVGSGQLRYISMMTHPGFGPAAAAQVSWITRHCTAIPPTAYDSGAAGRRPMPYDPTLFDCRH